MAKLNKSTRLVGGLEIWLGEGSRKGLMFGFFFDPSLALDLVAGWLLLSCEDGI